jgi:hypothetical protein
MIIKENKESLNSDSLDELGQKESRSLVIKTDDKDEAVDKFIYCEN